MAQTGDSRADHRKVIIRPSSNLAIAPVRPALTTMIPEPSYLITGRPGRGHHPNLPFWGILGWASRLLTDVPRALRRNGRIPSVDCCLKPDRVSRGLVAFLENPTRPQTPWRNQQSNKLASRRRMTATVRATRRMPNSSSLRPTPSPRRSSRSVTSLR